MSRGLKPNYFVLGAAKCGSSSLCALLGQHPDVFMVREKEPNFFSFSDRWEKGFGFYESLFKDAGDARLRGEGSVSYTMGSTLSLNVAERIFDYAPEAKFIYIVRHPVRRIESLWLHLTSMGSHRLNWFISNDLNFTVPQRPSFNRDVRRNKRVFIDTSNYWMEIDRYRKFFPDDQILVLFLEEFQTNVEASMQKCFSFLGADEEAKIDYSRSQINFSSERGMPRSFFSTLRSTSLGLKALSGMKRVVPVELRKSISNKLLRRKFPGRPELDQATRRWIIEMLHDDTCKFLEFYGRPCEYWDLNN